MNDKTVLNHIALQYTDKKEAKIFFTEILKIPYSRSFTISSRVSEEIFGKCEEIEIMVFEDSNIKFEIFISEKPANPAFNHICIEVNDRKTLIDKCKSYGLETKIVRKKHKKLVFIKDFSDNFFEIKEKT